VDRLRRAARAWPLAALIVMITVPLAVRGGFTATSRGLFVGLAAMAAAAVLIHDERSVRRSVREPAVLSLLGLAGLTLLSAVWTTGAASDAIRWGLVIAAYAATALVAAQAAREQGVVAIVVWICVLAAVEAAIGLVAAGLRVEPYAERIGGSWRPGGTLEYPPALALLEIFALPALLRGMVSSRRAVTIASAGAMALAAGAIGLADSRTEIALAVVLLAMAVVWCGRTVRAGRVGALLAGLVAAGAALAVRLALGGYAFPGATGGDAGRLLSLGAVVAGTVVVWAAVSWMWGRRWSRSSSTAVGSRRMAAGVAVMVVLGLGALSALSIAQRTGGPWTEPTSGFTHGREDQWRAAIDTALDHPVVGVGAEAYLRASAADQGVQASRYAHDLPLEAWAELGPLGLALVLALGCFAGTLLWRIRNDPRAWLVAPAVAAFLLANLVDWPWHLAGLGAVWAAALGACVAIDQARST
jgi:O-antigen ligase